MASFDSGHIAMSNNGLKFSGSWSRTGTKLTINLILSSKWTIDSQASGWTFGIYKSDGTALASSTFKNLRMGSNSVQYNEKKELFASATYELGTTNATTIKVGNITGLSYNGTTYRNMNYSISMGQSLLPPGPPTQVIVTGRFENGMQTYVSYSGATGTCSGYDIQRRFWTRTGTGTAVQSDWKPVEWNRPSTTIELRHSAVGDHAQQCRVRAVNAAGVSAWKESNWVYHDGVNLYTNNSGEKTYGKVRVWNGSEWKQAYVCVWNGSEWVTTK